MRQKIRGRRHNSDTAVRFPHAMNIHDDMVSDHGGFRLVHDRGELWQDLKLSASSTWQMRPHRVGRYDWDEDAPDASDSVLGFRLTADKEMK